MPKSGRNSTYPRCSNFPSQLFCEQCGELVAAREWNDASSSSAQPAIDVDATIVIAAAHLRHRDHRAPTSCHVSASEFRPQRASKSRRPKRLFHPRPVCCPGGGPVSLRFRLRGNYPLSREGAELSYRPSDPAHIDFVQLERQIDQLFQPFCRLLDVYEYLHRHRYQTRSCSTASKSPTTDNAQCSSCRREVILPDRCEADLALMSISSSGSASETLAFIDPSAVM